MHKREIAVAYGDGIGPEIMEACLAILDASGAPLHLHPIEIGERVYETGERSGIQPESWEILRGCEAFYKAPITTPQGGGFKSLNVTVRTTLGLYSNIRPCKSFVPFVKSKHPGMDVVIVRENEEDLYAGIEYGATRQTREAIKLITRPGCERIVTSAFEYAKRHGRKKVTCFSKDNILKLTDGLFREVFESIASRYPSIESEHWIIDIGAAKLADTPENFDVVVCANLYGDIISDIAAQIAGSVGLAGSANIGLKHAMFEAIHGSAPRRAGQNLANPTGLLMGGVMMLEHLGMFSQAALIYNAWAKAIEEGIHTYDIYNESSSKARVGTREFARAIIDRLGETPSTLPAKHLEQTDPAPGEGPSTLKAQSPPLRIDSGSSSPSTKVCEGIDIFVESSVQPTELAHAINTQLPRGMQLDSIYNRGVQVWPDGCDETLCVDQYRCRIFPTDSLAGDAADLLMMSSELAKTMDVCQAHLLFSFDEKRLYTLSPHQQ